MSPIRRGGILYAYIPRQSGGRVLRTTQTGDLRVYRGMVRMLADLKDGRRHWPLLAALDTRRLSLGQVYDAYTLNQHDQIQASLSAAALRPQVTAYLASCTARGLAARNVLNITRQLESFLDSAPSGTTADLTTAIVTAWLGTLTASPGTRRQYLYAVTGFTRYLCDVGVLADYPLTRVKAPKKNKSRMRYETEAVDLAIVRAARLGMRSLFAFIKGTGVDVSVALSTLRRDIDLTAGRANLAGTKTANREVHQALIETWALPFLRADLGEVLPNARPWAGITRSMAAHHHATCCTALEVDGYTLRDARHSVAVRMLDVGYNVMEIAEQLGNSPELVARVYARFVPRMDRKNGAVIPKTITQAPAALRLEGTTDA